jgi:hypothetical protein
VKFGDSSAAVTGYETSSATQYDEAADPPRIADEIGEGEAVGLKPEVRTTADVRIEILRTKGVYLCRRLVYRAAFPQSFQIFQFSSAKLT